MKFWLYFVGLLPVLFVVGVATLVLCLFAGMRRDLLRARAQMAGRRAAQAKREGNSTMLITGLTPGPRPRRCVACGVPEGERHGRGCVMTLSAQMQTPAGEESAAQPSTGVQMMREIDQVTRREEHERRLFETDLLLYCLERNTCLRDEERRRLYAVWRNSDAELAMIRRVAAGCTGKIDIQMQAITVQAATWRGWRRAGWQ